jgi:hypothetical protein
LNKDGQVLQQDGTNWIEEKSNDFLRDIADTGSRLKDKFTSLNLASQELIQLLIFTLVHSY